MSREVFSRHALASDIAGAKQLVRPGIARAKRPKRVAILAIHGINVQQRYSFQDQFALGLQSYLNAVKTGLGDWEASVYWPTMSSAPATSSSAVLPSALRIESARPAADTPVYDVYEGYWSPLTKGLTNVASMLAWLFGCLLLGDSSTAHIPCGLKKVRWDLGYVFVGLAVAALALAVSAGLGAWAWTAFTSGYFPSAPSFVDVIGTPLAVLKLPWWGYLELALDLLAILLVVLFVRAFHAAMKAGDRARTMARDASGKHFRRALSAGEHKAQVIGLLLAVVMVVALLAAIGFSYRVHHGFGALVPALIFIAAVAVFEGARYIGNFFVENVMGDVQVYTTHDTTAKFYAVRNEVVATVADTLKRILQERTEYDEIHVAAHSLGATVGMDVLIRVRQLLLEQGVSPATWSRIRSFITFGSALEKTRFFFDVRKPTVNASYDQFENDVYGSLFTKDPQVLAQPSNASGIYWINAWYFRDIVANEIKTYESDVHAGNPFSSWRNTPANQTERPICDNISLRPMPGRPFWAFVHGDYLSDGNFWAHVGPVVAV